MNLFVEHLDVAAENIGAQTLKTFFGGVTAGRPDRRRALGRRNGGDGGITLRTKRVVSQVSDWRSALHSRPFVNEHTIDDTGQRGSNVGARYRPKYRASMASTVAYLEPKMKDL